MIRAGLAVASIGLATAIATGSSAKTPGADAIPGEGFDVVSYELDLTPDVRSGTVLGRQTITLRATRDGVRRLGFSANALYIDSATVKGAAVTIAATDGTLGFELPRSLPRGRTVRLELSYHGRPARGLVRSATSLYTSYFACDWMICPQNAFGDKAAFSLNLRVPAGMDTLSVGGMVAKRPAPSGTEVHSWKAPRPYSTYLFGFAVGRFSRVTERVGSAELAYLGAGVDPIELRRRFAATGTMVRFLSDKAGLPLPVARYSQLLVDGGEAQEAATYSVLGTEVVPVNPGNAAEDWAIAHEVSHQWWGNLVTCATLRDFWLNEGITTFMTAAWKEHRYGRAAYDAELEVARSRLGKARAAGFDMPLAWDGQYPTLGARRAVQYSKGALFMDHLRTTLGEVAFWSGLRRYTRKHAGGTVTSIELQRAMEAASGRDLRAIFAEWVFGQTAAS